MKAMASSIAANTASLTRGFLSTKSRLAQTAFCVIGPPVIEVESRIMRRFGSRAWRYICGGPEKWAVISVAALAEGMTVASARSEEGRVGEEGGARCGA